MNIYLLIDQSGSMITNWTETIGAVNSYIRGLIGNKNVKGLRINIAAFDSDADLRFTEIRRNVKAKLWADITDKDAEPRGMTPLYDAIGRLNAIRSEQIGRANGARQRMNCATTPGAVTGRSGQRWG